MYWKAEYNDGTLLTEKIVSSDKLDRSKLSSFAIMDGEKVIIALKLEQRQRFFYRRRVEKRVGEKEDTVCHTVGKYSKDDLTALFVFEHNGNVAVISKFIENHPWFYSPQFVEGEEKECLC